MNCSPRSGWGWAKRASPARCATRWPSSSADRACTTALDNDLLEVELSANEQVHVLQVVREALTNIEHHAHARHAWVSLERGAGQAIEVTIEDDGVGIRDEQSPRGHFGLSIMRDRAQSVGGQLVIERRQPTGTRVRLVLQRADRLRPAAQAESATSVESPQ